MAALDLALRYIDDVTKQAAERRAQDVQNLEACRREGRLRPVARRRAHLRGAAAESQTAEGRGDRPRVAHARIPQSVRKLGTEKLKRIEDPRRLIKSDAPGVAWRP